MREDTYASVLDETRSLIEASRARISESLELLRETLIVTSIDGLEGRIGLKTMEFAGAPSRRARGKRQANTPGRAPSEAGSQAHA